MVQPLNLGSSAWRTGHASPCGSIRPGLVPRRRSAARPYPAAVHHPVRRCDADRRLAVELVREALARSGSAQQVADFNLQRPSQSWATSDPWPTPIPPPLCSGVHYQCPRRARLFAHLQGDRVDYGCCVCGTHEWGPGNPFPLQRRRQCGKAL